MSEPLSVADVLDRAADLIEPEGAWTQGVSARDEHGDEIDVEYGGDELAVCRCASQAIYAVSRTHFQRDPAHKFMADLLGEPIPAWNDSWGRTQAEVVAKLREAASLARRSAEFGNIGADGVQS